MSKSPEAFRTISEVAEELALPQHVLRFWETRFTSIKPMKRGGGRRYYRPDDVDLLRGIRALLYGEGYTIRGVQRILKEQGPRSVIAAARGQPAPVPAAAAASRPSPAAAPRPEAALRPTPAPSPEVDDDDDEDGADIRVEPPFTAAPALASADFAAPAFAPKEFRPAALKKTGPAATSTMQSSEMRRLEATLTHLLELKRRLDSARDESKS